MGATLAGNPVSLQRMQLVGWVYLIALTVGAGVAVSWGMAWSVFAGGVISITSFMVSKRGLSKFFDTLPTQGDEVTSLGRETFNKSGYLLRFWLRIAIIGVVLLLLLKSGSVNVFGLILGLSTVVFTVTFTALSVVKHYYFSGRR